MPRQANGGLTGYEQNQQFNATVAWLHGFRYKSTIKLFEAIQASMPSSRPIRVLEIGCAHGGLFDLLNSRFKIEYLGIEIAKKYYDPAVERYGHLPNFRAILGDAEPELRKLTPGEFDVIFALETLEHVPEHSVVRMVEQVARLAPRIFVCSVPVEVGPIVWIKNVGSLAMKYNRHNEYTWAETLWAGLGQLDKLPPHGVGHKGFDWRWLAQTIRHSHKIISFERFPFDLFPTALSTSVFIVAEPRQAPPAAERGLPQRVSP